MLGGGRHRLWIIWSKADALDHEAFVGFSRNDHRSVLPAFHQGLEAAHVESTIRSSGIVTLEAGTLDGRRYDRCVDRHVALGLGDFGFAGKEKPDRSRGIFGEVVHAV